MIILSRQQINNALPKIQVGLEKYIWLQKEVHKRNVATDREFQKKFNGFYRVRRNQEWQKKFYNLLERNKKNNVVFLNLLKELHKSVDRIEASFISKLLATINPKLPIIDKVVFSNLGLTLPSANSINRISVIDEQYKTLNKVFLDFLKTENGKYLIVQFVKKYPQTKITHTKMLDLVLWQTRT